MDFHSPYAHGYVRVAVCVPRVRVAEPEFNARQTIDALAACNASGAALAIFPELGISGYSIEDLLHQDALLQEVKLGLEAILVTTRELNTICIVGAPLAFQGQLFNCAVVLHAGRILGIVPKCYLPNYREFYEKRHFTSGRLVDFHEVPLLGQAAPFGSHLIFQAARTPAFTFHAEICEDVWTPIPPSTYAALGGATILTNLSASNVTVGKEEYRRLLCSSHSGKCVAAYLYSAAGCGESTTDLAWDGHALIYENGRLLAESERFQRSGHITYGDVDCQMLLQDRMRLTSFGDSREAHRETLTRLRRVEFDWQPPPCSGDLRRYVERFPYVPSDIAQRSRRAAEVYQIQVSGLAQRLEATGIDKVVVGISGGLDSTQALIVAARTMDRMELDRSQILAFTMPGFATSTGTLANAHALMRALRVTAREIDIRPSAMQMFRDLDHPFAEEEPAYDVTFENVQAGERTSHLFRLANHHNALVLGTGDLSELALGWSTYGVGDQMSHYNVNSSVPKTLIQHLIRWSIHTEQFGPKTCEVLQRILDTEISPELIPSENGAAQEPAQRSEETIGPFELQDFHLYYTSRYGFSPSKVAYLAFQAWGNRETGSWPEFIPDDKRNEYSLAEIRKWLKVFLFRFFQISQFKRSAIPNGPKVGSGGSLSPRGDWRAPSDGSAQAWLDELERNVPS